MKIKSIILLALVVILFIYCYRLVIGYLTVGLFVMIMCAVLGHIVSANTFRYHAKNPLNTIIAWPIVVIDLVKSYLM